MFKVRFFKYVLLLLVPLFITCQSPSSPASLGPPSGDAVLSLYRDSSLRPLVVEYFSLLTENRTVAAAVLEICDELAIPPALAFAVAWNESHFDPKAFNRNPSSVDRGLFQLNSRTFDTLSHDAVYDPKINAHHGLVFFKEALDRTGSVQNALTFYNSGLTDSRSSKVPHSTRIYIKNVMNDWENLDRDVIAWLYFSHQPELALK